MDRAVPTPHQASPAPARTGVVASRVAAERIRARELDDLRLQRPLTDAEHAEADRLAHRHYMRLYRQHMAPFWKRSK